MKSKVYVVGGAVRDLLLGLDPKDVDYVVVGATPEHMLTLGYQQVGADFPVFLHPTSGEEYALARIERKTGDGYLGFSVETENVSLEADLGRRDLTINAMAQSIRGKDSAIIDPFGGQEDLKNGILRHVSESFSEDPLRVIRLARFACRYPSFTIAPETQELCTKMVANKQLDHLPTERFWAELEKVFTERNPQRFFDVIFALGAIEHVQFFNELYYSPKHWEVVEQNARVCSALLEIEKDRRLRVHTALMAMNAATLRTADTRTQTLFHNMALLRNSIRRTDYIFNVLKQAKAWAEGNDLDDLVLAAKVAASTGEITPVSAAELNTLAELTGTVTAARFLDKIKPGPELGIAIADARKQIISNFLWV